MKLIVARTSVAQLVIKGGEVCAFSRSKAWTDGFLSGVVEMAPSTMVRGIKVAEFPAVLAEAALGDGPITRHMEESVYQLISESGKWEEYQMLERSIGSAKPTLKYLKPGATYWEIVNHHGRSYRERQLTYDGNGFFSTDSNCNITSMSEGFAYLEEF